VAPQLLINKDRDFLQLPYRILRFDLEHSSEAVLLNANLDFEYASGDPSVMPNLREAFITFSHGFGDLSLGKQITTWGSADANNPTDNINPFDYNYLMNEGGERKIGKIMLREDIYIKDFTLSLIGSPFFVPARMPSQEVFPLFQRPASIIVEAPVIGQLSIPFGEAISYPESRLRNSEVGARGRYALSQIEVAASYFEGYDRLTSPVLHFPHMQPPVFDYWAFHRTQVIGLEFIGLYRDFALRTEGAYFLTKDREGDDYFVRNPYAQYVAQLDWNAPGQTVAILQYMGMKSFKIDSTKEEDREENLPVGMGALFCGFAKSAVMGVVKKDIGDAPHRAEIRALYDIDKKGYMTGTSFSYSPVPAFYLKIGVNYFNGDDASVFKTLHSFSHLFLQGKYSF
jgi:hypothetical protein